MGVQNTKRADHFSIFDSFTLLFSWIGSPAGQQWTQLNASPGKDNNAMMSGFSSVANISDLKVKLQINPIRTTGIIDQRQHLQVGNHSQEF